MEPDGGTTNFRNVKRKHWARWSRTGENGFLIRAVGRQFRGAVFRNRLGFLRSTPRYGSALLRPWPHEFVNKTAGTTC
jgi:hypothetical protein